MDYRRIYDSLILKGKNRDRSAITGYTEIHHIIPESFFKDRKRKGPPGVLHGNPDDPENLVILTAREHFIAHLLLYRIHGDKKTFFALWKMCLGHRTNSCIIKSRVYEKLKGNFIRRMTGEGNPMYGKTSSRLGVPRSEETKKKISASNKGKKKSESHIQNIKASRCHEPLSEEHKLKISIKMKGVPKSEEMREKTRLGMLGKNVGPMEEYHKNKISNALKGRVFSESHRENLSRSQLGITRSPLSDEHKKRVSISLIGKKKPTVTCPHCNKSGGSGTMGRWHFKNCKFLK